jgi:predicted permease
MLFVLAVLFLSQQASYFSGRHDVAGPVGHVKIAAWLLLSIVLLLMLATGGGWFRSAEVRALLNDETTREHRRAGFVSGFWASCLAAIVIYAVDLFEPISGRDTVHIILTVAIAAAMLTFGRLERRAHRHA